MSVPTDGWEDSGPIRVVETLHECLRAHTLERSTTPQRGRGRESFHAYRIHPSIHPCVCVSVFARVYVLRTKAINSTLACVSCVLMSVCVPHAMCVWPRRDKTSQGDRQTLSVVHNPHAHATSLSFQCALCVREPIHVRVCLSGYVRQTDRQTREFSIAASTSSSKPATIHAFLLGYFCAGPPPSLPACRARAVHRCAVGLHLCVCLPSFCVRVHVCGCRSTRRAKEYGRSGAMVG
mmetsp:Transcript_3973/g.10081  ORF Transcript_3973/g.10081 Transcript_3973/m.10081 type:complete len:236 (+) Transcript_3973:679-1386(+)